MTDLCAPFLSRDLLAACNQLTQFCTVNFNPSGPFSLEHARLLHSQLPAILTSIFGAPGTRGWIQTETTARQDAALKNLLGTNSAFFNAMIRLSKHPDYSYDLVTESLPEDIRKALIAGATQFLPRLYKGNTYLRKQPTTGTGDIRASATRQSTIFSGASSGEIHIKFNMIQFYLYYVVSVATWTPLTPSPPPITTNMTTLPNRAPTIQPVRRMPHELGTSVPPPVRIRTIMCSVYDSIIQAYMQQFIPLGGGIVDTAALGSETFFLDALVELWLRTPWIPTGQKLSNEYMHYTTQFIRYVISSDLRSCVTLNDSVNIQQRRVYDAVKPELYMLLSRLGLNWSRHDDYLQVISLWSTWAAPWRLGAVPRSFEPTPARPLVEGWAPFILDNLLYYIPLVEIFLQRTSTFEYAEKQPTVNTAAPSQFPAPSSNANDPHNKLGGQLRILYRLLNVLKAENMTLFLATAEQGLMDIQSDAAGTLKASPTRMAGAVDVLAVTYFKNFTPFVREQLQKAHATLVQLGGGSWTPTHLYTKDHSPRNASATKSLEALHQSTVVRQDTVRTWVNVPSAPRTSTKTNQHLTELKQAAQLFSDTFELPLPSEKSMMPTRSLFSLPKSADKPKPKSAKVVEVQAGLSNGGFLTPEEKQLVIQGKMRCSHRNIPALGPRAEEVVHSYELTFMVRWIVPIDRWMNKHYLRWKPARFTKLPNRLTLRPLAATVNLVYLVLLLAILVACIL